MEIFVAQSTVSHNFRTTMFHAAASTDKKKKLNMSENQLPENIDSKRHAWCIITSALKEVISKYSSGIEKAD